MGQNSHYERIFSAFTLRSMTKALNMYFLLLDIQKSLLYISHLLAVIRVFDMGRPGVDLSVWQQYFRLERGERLLTGCVLEIIRHTSLNRLPYYHNQLQIPDSIICDEYIRQPLVAKPSQNITIWIRSKVHVVGYNVCIPYSN